MFGFALIVMLQIQSGRLRALGSASPCSTSSMPDPPIAESGVPGYGADVELGVLVPAHTIIDLLNAEVHKAMRLPDMAEAMKTAGVEIALSTPEAFGTLIESEMQRWIKPARDLNLKVE